MITGVVDVYYNVQDMDRAVRFYTEVLGMKRLSGDKYWTSLDANGVKIGLHGSDGPVPHVPRDSHGAHAGATLTLRSENVAEDRKTLERAGAKILGEANQPWGHMLIFEDLDGNVLKLMHPKR
jgi:catechol 2,3-dioxygenase-like lactoylglutathione lyase family enzyme